MAEHRSDVEEPPRARVVSPEALRAGGGGRSGPLTPGVVDGLVFGWRGGRRWPALVVHAETATVVDGAHRLAAARRLGLAEVAVMEVDGTPDEAFLVGVRANHRHGRPLTAGDRRCAVQRIVTAFPQLPYREVMAVTGASAGVVSRARAAAGLCSAVTPPAPAVEPEVLLRRLWDDPAMRRSPGGPATLLALKDVLGAARRRDVVPAHQVGRAAELLRWCAQALDGADLGGPR